MIWRISQRVLAGVVTLMASSVFVLPSDAVQTDARLPRRALPGIVLKEADCPCCEDMGPNYALGEFLKSKGVRWVIPSLETIRQEGEFVPLWRLSGMKYITPYSVKGESLESLANSGRGLDGFWDGRGILLDKPGSARFLVDSFGTGEVGLLSAVNADDDLSGVRLSSLVKELKWLPVRFGSGDVIPAGGETEVAAVFERAKEFRTRMDHICGTKCPKLMGLPSSACTNGRHEGLGVLMDAVFFNRYESVVPQGFSLGADARDWQAFGRASERMAKYENAVYDGRRADEKTDISPNEAVLQATYDHQGVRIVACLNGGNEARDVTVRTRGLSGRYRVVREDGVILFGGCAFTGEEIETTGVTLSLGAWSTCVIEFRPASILVYNEDETHPILDQSAEQYVSYLDSLCRGSVTHFFMCPNAQLSNVPSRFLEPTWSAQGLAGRAPRDFPAIMKKLHENGIDPYAIWTRRARERGVSPWLTVRMNDIHFVTDLSYWGHSRFWREHPEFRRNPADRGGNWEDYALDYSHREVRERMLGYIGELAERYDVDGIECDWMRFPYHLTKGREREKTPVLTEFMAEARRVVSDAAAKRGRRMLLGARVTSSYEGALTLGTDPVAWARAGAIDWLVVGNFFGTADFNLDYADWKQRILAADPNVTIVPSVDSGVRKEYWAGRQFLTLAELQGWCDTQYAQGAPGVYVFNPFHFEENGLETEWRGILEGALAPNAVVATGVRAYPVSFRECLSRMLPRALTDLQVDQPADGLAVRIRVGTVPVAGEVSVLIALDRTTAMLELLGNATLNGMKPTSVGSVPCDRWLTKGTLSKGAFALEFPVLCLRPGVNVLQLPPLKSVTLVACEMEVRTK